MTISGFKIVPKCDDLDWFIIHLSNKPLEAAKAAAIECGVSMEIRLVPFRGATDDRDEVSIGTIGPEGNVEAE